MDADPYDAWYLRELRAEGATDSMYQQANWDFFAINHDAQDASKPVKEKEVKVEEINQWLAAQVRVQRDH